MRKYYDIRERRQIIEQVEKNRRLDKLERQLEMFLAIHMGIAPFFSKKGSSAANSWKSKLIREMKRLLGIKVSTVWDRIKKKANRI